MPSTDQAEGVRPMPVQPVLLTHLFGGLHEELTTLLRELTPRDWERPTSAADWSVRDVAAHLLDVDLRRLSVARDGHLPAPPTPIRGYRDLLGYLDRLNAEWVSAARRLSPALLIELLAHTGPAVAEHMDSLDAFAPAPFGVGWAGQERSPNWLDIGREFTERWHHQDQIREAVGRKPLTDRRWLGPVLDISMRALPHAYRDVGAPLGTAVAVVAHGAGGGAWSLIRGAEGWALHTGAAAEPRCHIDIDAVVVARLLLQRLPHGVVPDTFRVSGDSDLARPFLRARAVMVEIAAPGIPP